MASTVVGNSELMTWGRTPVQWATTRGRIEAHDGTFITLNGAPVQRVSFAFEVDDRVWHGVSFTTSVPSKKTVTIEYAAADPSFARIRGMRTKALPAWVALTLVFPAIGVALVAAGFWLGTKRLHYLRDGQMAWGTLAGVEATEGTVNDRKIHRLAFAYVDHRQTARVARLESHREELRDPEIARRVLYLPDVEDAVVVEVLPGPPRVGDAGQFVSLPGYEVLRVLALPTAALLAIGGGSFLWV